jgi:toxin-antitoxin system PIN domain toxin
MKPVALLDVNVLIALFDSVHTHHDLAHDWFADNRQHGWATCPLTENGLLRILPTTSRRDIPVPPSLLAEHLRQFCASGQHVFWPDAISLRDEHIFDLALVRGHRQITDVYLLGLAVEHGGRLVTFDQSMSISVVKGATRASLETLSPADAD